MPTAFDMMWFLLEYFPVISGCSFALCFAVCLLVLRRHPQKPYRATVLSVAAPELLLIGPAVAVSMWLSLAELSVPRRTIMATLLSLFAFPQSLALAALCAVAFVRHRRSTTAAYRAEALAAVSIALVGAYWTHEVLTGDWH